MSLIGRASKEYVSTLSFVDKREILNKLLDIYDEEASFMDILELTGRTKKTDREEFSAILNTRRFNSCGISAIDVGANGDTAGEDIKVTVTGEVPRVGEQAMFTENKGVVGIVKAVSGSDVTIKTISSDADDILNPAGTTVSTSGKIIFFGSAHGEGSDAPSKKRTSTQATKNFVQIFKEAGGITDMQAAAAVEFTYKGKDSIMFKEQHDTLVRHKAKMAHAFLWGKKGTGTDANGNKEWYTQGLRNYILNGDGDTLTTGGYQLALASATITKTSLRTLERKLDVQGAPSDYMWLAGGDLALDLHDLFHNMAGIKEGGINYNLWGDTNGKQKYIDLGLEAFKPYTRKFHLKRLSAYDNPELGGAGALDYDKEAFILPLDKVKTEGGGGLQDRIQMRFMPVGGEIYHEQTDGRFSPNKTNSKGVFDWSYETIAGIEALGINHFALVTP